LYRTWDGNVLSPIETASVPGLLKNAGIVGSPQIALFQGFPYVVFHGDTGFSDRLRDYEILLARRGNEGGWSISQLSDSSHDGVSSDVPLRYFGSTNPSIAVGVDGSAHVVWQNSLESKTLQIQYASVTQAGVATVPSLVADGIEVLLPSPQIALTQEATTSTVHLTWQYPRQCDSGAMSVGVRYAFQRGDATTFEILSEVTHGDFCAAGSKSPSLTVPRQSDYLGVFVVWTSPHGGTQNADRDLYMVRVTEGTVSGDPMAINEPVDGQNSNTNHSDSATSTLINGNVLRACWHEKDPSPTAADLDIFCAWRTL